MILFFIEFIQYIFTFQEFLYIFASILAICVILLIRRCVGW